MSVKRRQEGWRQGERTQTETLMLQSLGFLNSPRLEMIKVVPCFWSHAALARLHKFA